MCGVEPKREREFEDEEKEAYKLLERKNHNIASSVCLIQWPPAHTSFITQVEDQAHSSFLAETVVYSTLLPAGFIPRWRSQDYLIGGHLEQLLI
jgi:hypothetical protein